MKLQVGARSSPLSRVQVAEVKSALTAVHPHIDFSMSWVETTGDLDKQTSLRTLEKTNFFTKELDALLLSGAIQVAIHSAKDLPEPLPAGLELIALTKGIDPRDALVLQEGMCWESLPKGARVATSSLRREEIVRQMRADLTFLDLRGTIEERLAKLDRGEADAVVIAEAALIRLGLTHRNRLFLPGETAPLQGKLALVARADDKAMQELFACVSCI